MKKTRFFYIIIFILAVILLSSVFMENYRVSNLLYQFSGRNNPEVMARAVIIMDQNSETVIMKKNARAGLYPASLTKILTTLLVLENLDLSEVITVGEEVDLIQPDGSRAGLEKGHRIEVRDLIIAMLLPSGNDAAYTAAIAVGRKIKNQPDLPLEKALSVFMARMNERAKSLGCKTSNFTTPDGYHHKKHYSSAYDILLITQEAMKHTYFKDVVGMISFSPELGNHDTEVVWKNRNELLNKDSIYYYQGASGVKTGFTTPAGYCLVSSASKDGTQLISVVLGSTFEGRWTDTRTLFEYGLNKRILRNPEKELGLSVPAFIN